MLDWDESSSDWRARYYEKCIANPPLLFEGCDIEILPFEETNPRFPGRCVRRELDELADPEDFRGISTGFKFIPFAQSGGGDLHVFQYNLRTGDDVPVAFLWHDSDEAKVLARNFRDFLFRSLIARQA